MNNFAAADTFDCDRLIAVEVLTPGGNWSSYPPHKHDEHVPGEECELEEIYYFEVQDGGLGYHRVSPSRDGGTDVLAEVRGGDVVLIPDGWHGPSIAPPGRTLYYLNVMAGPGGARLADPRPSRPPVDPRHLAGRADRRQTSALHGASVARPGGNALSPKSPASPTGPAHPTDPAGPKKHHPAPTRRLTTAQALVAFLARQYTERDGRRQRLISATWGIFGHGNVAGIGQALVEAGHGGTAPRTACRTSRAATNRPWCTRPWGTPASRGGSPPRR